MSTQKHGAADVAKTQYEQTFADLANARLRDEAPALQDYLIGFQLVDCEPDGSRAVGLHGLQIGDNLFYITSFFLNGEVKGMDSIYGPDSDLFVPLNEDWVNEIINRRGSQLGEPNKQSDSERGTKAPNYNRLRQIPTGGGGAVGTLGLNYKAASEAVQNMAAKCASDESSVEEAISLPDALAAMGPHVAQGFIDDMRRNPKLAAYVAQFYSPLDFYVPVEKTAASKDEDVTIISGIAQSGTDQLTDDQKEQVLRGGTAVIDKRPELKKSKVYRTQVHQCMTNPTAGGLYDVLLADGSVSEMLVLRIAGSDDIFCLDLDSGKRGLLHTHQVYTLRQYEPAEFRKRLEEETIAADAVRANDAVVFVSQSGEASMALSIESVTSGVDNTKLLHSGGEYYGLGRGCYGETKGRDTGYGVVDKYNRAGTVWRYEEPAHRVKDVIVSEAGGGQIRYLNDKLAINSRKFRALVLDHGIENDGWVSWKNDGYEDRLLAADFGDFNTVREQMEKVAYPVKLWTESDYIVVKDEAGAHTFGKVAALGYLIRKHGCAADDAETMISEAVRAPSTFHIKAAAQLLPVAEPNDESEGGFMSSYHKTQVPVQLAEMAPSEDNRQYYQYQSPYGYGGDGDNDAMSEVENAAKTGQKEVFDAGVIGSLVKTHRAGDSIEKFMPTIVGGMDRLGRLLFLFYWHMDDFQERFGDNEVTELTDDLKSAFEQIGDLVLKLKKKSLAGDPDYYGLGLNSSMEG